MIGGGWGAATIAPLLPPRIPFVSLCASLEDAGYHREEIGRLTRWYILRVLNHPRSKGAVVMRRVPWFVDPSLTDTNRIRRILLRQGCPAWRIEARLQEVLAERARRAREEVERKAATARKKRGKHRG